MVSLYDPFYKRLRLRNYIDSNGVEKELRLPFCSMLDDINISNSSSVSKYQYQSGKYKSSILKRINRRSPVTIKGIVASDSQFSHDLIDVIPEANFKTLDEYLYALNHLQSTVIYAFDGITGTMNIESIQVDSYGKVRNFEITGYRVC